VLTDLLTTQKIPAAQTLMGLLLIRRKLKELKHGYSKVDTVHAAVVHVARHAFLSPPLVPRWPWPIPSEY
jgi:hypothetical protein